MTTRDTTFRHTHHRFPDEAYDGATRRDQGGAQKSGSPDDRTTAPEDLLREKHPKQGLDPEGVERPVELETWGSEKPPGGRAHEP
jgi:hypothetical protein